MTLDYSIVRFELSQFIYNNNDITITQKQRAMYFLLIGIYKTAIMEMINSGLDIDKIKQNFLETIVLKIK